MPGLASEQQALKYCKTCQSARDRAECPRGDFSRVSHPDHSCQSTAGDLEHRRTATLPSTEGDYFLWHLVAEGGCAGAEERKHEPGRRTAGRRLMRTQQATCSAALRQVCSSCPHHIQHAHMHNPNPCFPANAADLGLKSCYHCQRPRLILSRVITKVRYSRSQQGTHTHTHTPIIIHAVCSHKRLCPGVWLIQT